MDNNMMNNNYYYGQQTMGQPYYGGYDPNMFGYQAYGYNNIPTPANQNALTAEEIQMLKNTRPSSKIELSIDRTDVIRSMCTHKENGKDVVMQVNDGSGDVWCPICNRRWKPDMKTKEEVQELVTELIDQMENAKWAGDLPTDLTRELFTLIPLLNKYPDIHEYAMNTFNKYYSARGMYNAADTNIYGMYNSLFGANVPSTGFMGAPMQGYYGQPAMAQGGYYGGQQAMAQGYVPNGVQANPVVNPMQAPTYGVNPVAPNQQFVSQANMMMGGTVNPQQPMFNNTMSPVYGTPQVQQGQQQSQQQPAQQQNAGGPVITPQNDGTVTSSKKIDL